MYSELDTFYRHLLIQTVRKTRSLANRLNLTGVKGGLPHSEIHGSKLIRSSPWLIAAYHVLHRLSAPRHPPNALKALDRSHDRCPQSYQLRAHMIRKTIYACRTDPNKTGADGVRIPNVAG